MNLSACCPKWRMKQNKAEMICPYTKYVKLILIRIWHRVASNDQLIVWRKLFKTYKTALLLLVFYWWNLTWQQQFFMILRMFYWLSKGDRLTSKPVLYYYWTFRSKILHIYVKLEININLFMKILYLSIENVKRKLRENNVLRGIQHRCHWKEETVF